MAVYQKLYQRLYEISPGFAALQSWHQPEWDVRAPGLRDQ